MKILYYTWGEITKEDQIEALQNQGCEVRVLTYPLTNYMVDGKFVEIVEQIISEEGIDGIFTVDFFPIISKVALRKQIPYISWIFDSPFYGIYTEMIYNPYNFIFHFDGSEVEKFRARGVEHIYHMPLAVNVKRLDALIRETQPDEKLMNSQISFLGNLYDDKNTLDQIQGISQYSKGALEGLIQAQMCVIGYPLIETAITENVIKDLREHTSFQLDEEFFLTERDMLIDMIYTKTTMVERKELLQLLSKDYETTLYSASDSSELKNVVNKGYLNYRTQMPVMFHHSAINLNITLRTIRSGISLRCMDIMGAGGFLLSNYQPELAELFTEGEEMVMYYSREDLIQKVNYYLTHEEERKQIARIGREKILKEYTYDIQMKKMIDTVFH